MAEEELEGVTEGSGNVFADLGFENPEEELAKAKLLSAIADVIKQRKLNLKDVAATVQMEKGQVSKLLRGGFGGFTTDRLLRMLNQLGQDVEITVRPKPPEVSRSAHVTVATYNIL